MRLERDAGTSSVPKCGGKGRNRQSRKRGRRMSCGQPGCRCGDGATTSVTDGSSVEGRHECMHGEEGHECMHGDEQHQCAHGDEHHG